MIIPESDKQHQDVIDLIIDGANELTDIKNQDGTIIKALVLNPETIYWSTRQVSDPTFGKFVLELKIFESLADQCYNNMCGERADVIAKQIRDIVKNFKHSINAKSSESIRDHLNSQQTLIDKINRIRIERAVTLKGEVSKGLLDGIRGKQADTESNRDV